MAKLHDLLRQERTLILDGSWGTALSQRGCSKGCPELWNDQYPDAIRQLVRDYEQAGSDIILTNSFGGSPFKLAGYGLEDRTEELNGKAARLSREAASDKVAIMASVGPTGVFLEPIGPVTEAEMRAAFRRQIAALLRGGVDGIVIETMSALEEALCAVQAAKDEGVEAVTVTMTFERKKKGMVTMMGVEAAHAAEALTEAGCTAVGANCGSGIEDMVEVIKEMRKTVSTPLWAKPNAGLPEVRDGETVFPESPEEMAGKYRQLIEAGARFIGGCCGTTPEHIRRLTDTLNE